MNWQTLIDREAEAARQARRGAGAQIVPGPAISPSGGFSESPRTPLLHVPISVAAAGTTSLIAGVAGLRIKVFELLLWNVTSQNLELLNGSRTLTGVLQQFPNQSGIYLPNLGEPHFELDDGASFNLATSAATQVSGYVLFRMEAS